MLCAYKIYFIVSLQAADDITYCSSNWDEVMELPMYYSHFLKHQTKENNNKNLSSHVYVWMKYHDAHTK